MKPFGKGPFLPIHKLKRKTTRQAQGFPQTHGQHVENPQVPHMSPIHERIGLRSHCDLNNPARLDIKRNPLSIPFILSVCLSMSNAFLSFCSICGRSPLSTTHREILNRKRIEFNRFYLKNNNNNNNNNNNDNNQQPRLAKQDKQLIQDMRNTFRIIHYSTKNKNELLFIRQLCSQFV